MANHSLAQGVRLSPEEAKARVDRLYAEMMEFAHETITEGRFMRDLRAGRLPREALKVFWLNWHNHVAEINNFIQVAYQRHLPFFKRNLDLYASFADKVADELIHPKPPGHLHVVWEQGRLFGIESIEEMIEAPMLPECRALTEWHRGLLYEGTMAEFWSSIAYEEYVGHWSAMFGRALVERYGFAPDQVPYFKTHEEADLAEHEGGIMAHGTFNRMVLQRMLEQGECSFRPGFSMEYCNRTSLVYRAWFLEASYRAALGEPRW